MKPAKTCSLALVGSPSAKPLIPRVLRVIFASAKRERVKGIEGFNNSFI
jgi:hypothetical protein